MSQEKRDRELGMARKITRRDFVNGASVALGTVLAAPNTILSEMLRVAVRVRRGPRALGLSRSAFCREFGCAKVPNPLIKSGVQEAVVTIVGFRPGCRNKKMHD